MALKPRPKQAAANPGADWNILAKYFSVPIKRADPALTKIKRSEAGRDGAAMRQAKALAAQHGIDIELDTSCGERAWWVTHPDLADTDADPLEGNHFCTDGREVLQAVQAYVAHLTAGQAS